MKRLIANAIITVHGVPSAILKTEIKLHAARVA